VQSKTGKTVIVPLHRTLLNFLAARKKDVGRVSAATPIWPDKAELYRLRGARAFSNIFYDEVLLKCGLVPARDHKKTKQTNTDTRKVNEVSYHSLRHTFVSLLKASGATQAIAKELAGHSSDAMSDLYTHVPEKALAAAIKKLPNFQE
jgi:integrase